MKDHRGYNAGWRARAEEARRIRHTCVKCGLTGLPEVARKTPACVDVPLFVDDYGTQIYGGCGGRGHLFKEVARVTGFSQSSVAEYIADPDRERARVRRRDHHGTCGDCGGRTADRKTYRCGWCQRGVPSPHLLETSPTGFRRFASTTCGTPGCENEKAPGRHVCEWHAARLAKIRQEIDEGAQSRLEYGGMAGVGHPDEDDRPLIAA